MDIRETIELLEAKNKRNLAMYKLPFNHSALSPVMSSALIDLHYGKLYRGYVDRYNDHEGDDDFNESGAFLHEKFFSQFQVPKGSNRPTGRILDHINEHFGTFQDFKTAMHDEAKKFQGSGWIYLSKNGSIRKITNHAKRTDIVLLIDLWEHAYQLVYHADRGKYVDEIWRIINWNTINHRL